MRCSRRRVRGLWICDVAKATIALPMGIFGKQTDLLVEKGALKKKTLNPKTPNLSKP